MRLDSAAVLGSRSGILDPGLLPLARRVITRVSVSVAVIMAARPPLLAGQVPADAVEAKVWLEENVRNLEIEPPLDGIGGLREFRIDGCSEIRVSRFAHERVEQWTAPLPWDTIRIRNGPRGGAVLEIRYPT